MKIAMIGHKRIPSREGGIEVVVEELAVRMAAEGHEVTVYNRHQRGQAPSPKSYKGVTLRDVPTLRLKGSDAAVYAILATVAALFGHYDVIHFHAEGPSGMAWLPHLFHIPTVATIHGLDWQRGKWNAFASSYLKASEKTAAKRADEMIVLSEHLADYFRETYGRETRFIRNGISVGERRPPQEIRKLGLQGNDYILFLARLVPEKGLHYLLEAFRGINTDLKLVVAGSLDSNDYVARIQTMAAADRRVILAGFVQGELLDELFSNCRLYVLPSDVEGMPLSLLEALSYGAPCLVSDIPETQVAPEEYLTVFRHGETEDLLRQMQRALKFPPTPEQREAQAAWMKEHYSWDAVVEETLTLYKTVTRKDKGVRRGKHDANRNAASAAADDSIRN